MPEVMDDARGKTWETLLANGVDLTFVTSFPEHSDRAQTWRWMQGRVKVNAVLLALAALLTPDESIKSPLGKLFSFNTVLEGRRIAEQVPNRGLSLSRVQPSWRVLCLNSTESLVAGDSQNVILWLKALFHPIY